MKSKISIIIPCYNVQKYIMRCFESIHNQTYGFENLEVIFIDDLSIDNTYSIIESLQKRYPQNVISMRMEKKGLAGGARNLGMDVCSGEYITFVDADDWIHPEMISILYDKIRETDSEIVQCDNERFDTLLPVVEDSCSENVIYEEFDLLDINNRRKMIIKLTNVSDVIVWGKLYKTKFIKQNNIRFVENQYFEDNYFSFLCVLLAEKYCKIKNKLYFYYNNIEGITSVSMNFEKIRDLCKGMDAVRDAMISHGLDKTVGEECKNEIQVVLMWKSYFETWSKLEAAVYQERKLYKEHLLENENRDSLLKNPYIQNVSDRQVVEAIGYLKK